MSEKGYLQTKKLCVGYQKHIVVDNIEISLEQGEILTLIGPNGAGKSTVLKLSLIHIYVYKRQHRDCTYRH